MKIAVLASGTGTNCRAIFLAIQEKKLDAEITAIISNRADSGVLTFAKEQGLPYWRLSSEQFSQKEEFYKKLLDILAQSKTELIVLAGYMKKVPLPVIRQFANRIINIHPALLPSFGGKGMFGRRVHEAVLDYGAKVTGITIHLVDEEYDHGPVVMQKVIEVLPDDTPGTLAQRVQTLEHQYYYQAIQLFAEKKIQIHQGKVIIQ